MAGPSLNVSKKAIDLIVEFEVSSATYYNKNLQKPIWPGAASGVTIGIGYDLGYNTAAKIRSDWGSHLSQADVNALVGAAGVKGTAASGLIPGLAHVKVSFAAAQSVFTTSTLPRYAKDTRNAYPGLENLPADAQGGLLSLVFNRGTAMAGDKRREMKAIKPLVVAGDLAGIADQIRSMKRLWNPTVLAGLHKRRDREAKLVENARSTYPAGEIVGV